MKKCELKRIACKYPWLDCALRISTGILVEFLYVSIGAIIQAKYFEDN